MDHDSAIKRNELPIQATTFMDLKGIVLNGKQKPNVAILFQLYNILKMTR